MHEYNLQTLTHTLTHTLTNTYAHTYSHIYNNCDYAFGTSSLYKHLLTHVHTLRICILHTSNLQALTHTLTHTLTNTVDMHSAHV